MGKYISYLDFKGPYALPTDKFTKKLVEEYIDDKEVPILCELLGATLYKAFEVDYEAPIINEPTDPKFVVIYNAFAIDDDCGILKSEGIKVMLAKLLYFEIFRDGKVQKKIGGPSKDVQSNAEEASYVESNIYQVYNQGVETYCAIQEYICRLNPSDYDYDAFNGQILNKTTFV